MSLRLTELVRSMRCCEAVNEDKPMSTPRAILDNRCCGRLSLQIRAVRAPALRKQHTPCARKLSSQAQHAPALLELPGTVWLPGGVVVGIHCMPL